MSDKANWDIKPERMSAPPVEERKGLRLAVMGGLAAICALAGGAYYFYRTAEMFNPYTAVYQRLGIALPRSFETIGPASRHLDQLRREPCDKVAMTSLVELMESAGHLREGALSSEVYNRDCSFSGEMLLGAYQSYARIGDLKAAIRVVDELIKFDPASYRYRYMRAKAYEDQKNYKAALADYISTLELFPDLSKVAGSEFYHVSDMYDKVGRPCDAIAPLETYVSYNVRERQTQQIARLITDYAQKGKCAATYANGSARVAISVVGNLVDVTINGTRARMVVDTGATLVSLTPEMAARARITPDLSDQVEVKVVGGMMKLASASAQTLQVGDAIATNDPLLVSVGSKDAYGPGIDGLLGMSFLSRYTVAMSPGVLELKVRSRAQ
jgi:aspartyl protease family protein